MLKIKVPITNYKEVNIDYKDMIELLQQEKKELHPYWDTIVMRTNGTGYYHNIGYGSHDIGEKDGPDVEEDILNKYKLLNSTIDYFRTKLEESK